MTTNKAENLTFFFELTDTFGGDANYSWVSRFKVTAKTGLGALRKVTKEIGLQGSLKRVMSGELSRWDVQGSAMCLFCSDWNEEDKHYSRINDLYIVLE